MEKLKFIEVSSEMTGGGIITYWGLLEDGRYFVYGNDVFSFCDADYGYTFTKEFYKKTGGDTFKWEKKHCKTTYYSPETFTPLVNDIIQRVIEICGTY